MRACKTHWSRLRRRARRRCCRRRAPAACAPRPAAATRPAAPPRARRRRPWAGWPAASGATCGGDQQGECAWILARPRAAHRKRSSADMTARYAAAATPPLQQQTQAGRLQHMQHDARKLRKRAQGTHKRAMWCITVAHANSAYAGAAAEEASRTSAPRSASTMAASWPPGPVSTSWKATTSGCGVAIRARERDLQRGACRRESNDAPAARAASRAARAGARASGPPRRRR